MRHAQNRAACSMAVNHLFGPPIITPNASAGDSPPPCPRGPEEAPVSRKQHMERGQLGAESTDALYAVFNGANEALVRVVSACRLRMLVSFPHIVSERLPPAWRRPALRQPEKGIGGDRVGLFFDQLNGTGKKGHRVAPEYVRRGLVAYHKAGLVVQHPEQRILLPMDL